MLGSWRFGIFCPRILPRVNNSGEGEYYRPECLGQSGFLVKRVDCMKATQKLVNSQVGASSIITLFQCILGGYLLSRHPLSWVCVAFLIPHSSSNQLTTSCGGFRQIDLPNIILSTSLFWSKVVIKHYQKKAFICWLLTLFKSAKKPGCSTCSFYTSLLMVGYSPSLLLLTLDITPKPA